MTTSLLDDVIGRLTRLPDIERDKVVQDAIEATRDMVWVPNPGPQTQWFNCQADELFCGGQAGPGKSDVIVGLGLTQHVKSLILRRFNDDAKVLAERAMAIVGSRDGYNGQAQILRLPGKMLEFGGCKDLEDRQRYKGDPHDLIGFDEIGDFLEAQYTFIIAWNRSTIPGQRCRVVGAGNPPTTPEGLWVIRRWAAWLDPSHPKFGKIKEGELLWYTTIGDKDTEVDGPGPHWINGESIMAKSRTFIRGKLTDNPDLSKTNYDAVLAALPERERLAYREGRFDASLKDKAFQLIPSAWVRAAQARWTERPPDGVPMCAMFVDCTGGGVDPMAIASRHDGWYAPIHVTPGNEIPDEYAGRYAAGIVVSQRRDNALMIIDMGGGYGGPLYEHLHMNFDQNTGREPIVKAYRGSEASVLRTSDGTIGFNNVRTQTLWKFREALDPGQVGGSPIMLPPDDELFGDLTAPGYKLERGVYHAEPKVDVCKRLGRSTNKGDAVTGAWSAGPIASTDGAIWDEVRKEMGRRHRGGTLRQRSAIMGRQAVRR